MPFVMTSLSEDRSDRGTVQRPAELSGTGPAPSGILLAAWACCAAASCGISAFIGYMLGQLL
jgi:hypothetical protein